MGHIFIPSEVGAKYPFEIFNILATRVCFLRRRTRDEEKHTDKYLPFVKDSDGNSICNSLKHFVFAK